MTIRSFLRLDDRYVKHDQLHDAAAPLVAAGMNQAPKWIKAIVISVSIVAALNATATQLRRPRPADLTSTETATLGDHGVVVLNPFTTSAQSVARLRSDGLSVACLVRTAQWEPTRPDAGRYRPSVIGAPVRAGGTIRWLDLRRWDAIQDILADRFSLCAAKGFDAITFGPLDGSTQRTGFPVTPADEITFEQHLLALAHAHHLTVRPHAGVDVADSAGRRRMIGS